MGTLVYGPGARYEFDDRSLSHVKIAIALKLRRHESFLLNWMIPSSEGSGRLSLWVSPSTDLQFIFDGSRPPELNKAWIEALMLTSNRTGGMDVMPEEDAQAFIVREGGPVGPAS